MAFGFVFLFISLVFFKLNRIAAQWIFQRIGDQMWLAGDIKARGFLLGATSGRTTARTASAS